MIKKVIALVALLFAFAGANENILVYKVENKNHAISAETIAEGLSKNGYVVAKNQDMNGPYKIQFGESTFHSYNLMSVYHADFASKAIAKSASAGIFAPFSIGVYQRNGEDDLYLAILSGAAEQRILNVQDKSYDESQALSAKTIESILPNAKISALDYASTKTDKDFYTKYSFEVEDEDAQEGYEGMMMMMRGNMKTAGFVVANYIDFNEVLKENGVEDYEFFHSFSLCKLKIIYELSKKTPEAGSFAPCTMVIYHKKGSDKTEIVSLNINGLISMLALKDKNLVDMLDKTQAQMISIIEESAE